ncbi:MAG: chemotaxis protein CheX [Desulfobacterales bacterium]|nr:chemotaxis protein CheX [Desulfobacterales bacterium]
MDAKFINPFINATLKVIETMAFIKAAPGTPYVKKDDVAKGDISGVIGITGKTNGIISVTFDESCILEIVSSMFNEKLTTIDRDIADAVGELTNMISGQARLALSEMGHSFKAAIPSVIRGKNHTLMHIVKGPKIAIPFTTSAGNFTIEVCFDK